MASLIAAPAKDQESPHLLIVVPWTVIQELNGLKSSARKHVPEGSNHSQHAAGVGTLAAKANSFLYRVLQESEDTDHATSGKAAILRGQQLSETLEAQVENNDDIILDCCRCVRRYLYTATYSQILPRKDETSRFLALKRSEPQCQGHG